jgi:hypothetical protein
MHQLLPLGWEYHVFSPPAQHFPRLVNLLRLRFPWLKGTPPSPGVAAPPGAQRWLGLVGSWKVPPESWISSGKIRDFDGKNDKKRMFSASFRPGKWLLRCSTCSSLAGSPSVVTQLIIEQVRMVSLMPFTQVVSQFRWRAKELLRISQPRDSRDMSFYHIIWSLWYPYNLKKFRIDYQG